MILVLIVGVLVSMLLSLQWRLWLGDGGYREVAALEKRLTDMQEQVQQFNERNRALAAEVIDLKNGLEAIEELARSQYGMLRDDETYYHMPGYEVTETTPLVRY